MPVPGHACWSLEALAAANPHLASQLHTASDLEAGLTLAGTSSGRIVVAGSLYLLGQLLTATGSAAGQR